MPQVSTQLSWRDTIGTIGARSGFARNNYKINPGLYAIGSPTRHSEVVVTANYKLTFDHIRKSLQGIDIWLLVIDTRGINVWCAAGKGTFSTEEISYQVLRAGLANIVSHRTLILPQLAAAGVALYQLPQKCGFHGKYGPIRIEDLPTILNDTTQEDDYLRSVTFSLKERAVLIPVELQLILKPLLLMLIGVTIFSGIGPGGYSISKALDRGLLFLITTTIAIFAGGVLTPLMLPLVPCRQFWLKGAIVSLFTAVLYSFLAQSASSILETVTLSVWIIAAGSFMAMNFTGSTPFTSLSGVEYEMRRGLPFQIILTTGATLVWIALPFCS